MDLLFPFREYASPVYLVPRALPWARLYFSFGENDIYLKNSLPFPRGHLGHGIFYPTGRPKRDPLGNSPPKDRGFRLASKVTLDSLGGHLGHNGHQGLR